MEPRIRQGRKACSQGVTLIKHR